MGVRAGLVARHPPDLHARATAHCVVPPLPPNDLTRQQVRWLALDAADEAALAPVFKGSDAVISTIGVFFGNGAEQDRALNGRPNVAAARAAKAAGVGRFVYVSVSEMVAPVAAPLVGDGYFKGKADAEAAILDAFGEDKSLIIRPTFIYGGEAFSANPPRVDARYGKFIDGLLSSSVVRSVAELSPAPIRLTLEPPVDVKAVAAAAIAGAAGKSSGSVDGKAAILGAGSSTLGTG